MLSELMAELKKRPQTWVERHAQLQRQGRAPVAISHDLQYLITWLKHRNYPCFNGLLQAEKEIFFWETKKIVDIPLMINEERYPDIPGYVLIYFTEDPGNTTEFWQVFGHLEGNRYHACDRFCEKHQLNK